MFLGDREGSVVLIQYYNFFFFVVRVSENGVVVYFFSLLAEKTPLELISEPNLGSLSVLKEVDITHNVLIPLYLVEPKLENCG